VDEEVVMLEEQLAAAHADIELLQTRLAEAESRDAERAAKDAELKRQISTLEAQLTEQSSEVEGLRSTLTNVQEQARDAAQRYRQAVLDREPELPAELVSGGSVSEVDDSVARARETVSQVRLHLEQQAQARRVPAGAPVRGEPDVAELSASEKIRLGLRGG
jgi:predicted RNase H-like nuclease (RuvC/YqgF family)